MTTPPPLLGLPLPDRAPHGERLELATALVGRIVDGLGLPVDEAVAPLVAALLAGGVETSGSCGGHLAEGDRPRLHPWVDLEADRFDLFEMESEEIHEQAAVMTTAHLENALPLARALAEFNTGREPGPARLLLVRRGIWGVFRLTTAAGIDDRCDAELDQEQAEVAAFARWLVEHRRPA